MACDRESAGCKMRDLVDRLLKVPGSMTGDCYDASDYTFLFDTFVREVVGRRTFDKQKAEKKLKDYTTCSDEALTLVLLDNGCDRWIDSFENPGKKNKDLKKTLYTAEGRGKNAARDKGWTNDGRKRYHALNKNAKERRSTSEFVSFENDFKEMWFKQKMNGAVRTKTATTASEDVFDVGDDLSEAGFLVTAAGVPEEVVQDAPPKDIPGDVSTLGGEGAEEEDAEERQVSEV